jgi:Proteobacterial transcriptional regulator-like domain
MPRRRFYVGPLWPAKLGDYDYLRRVGNPDWAWEFLRRNPLYQRDQRFYQLFSEKAIRHARGLLLTRTRRRCCRAEAWDLCSFRGSLPAGAQRASHVAA